MDNAADAILIGGAMLIFVLALTVSITVYSQARVTIDAMLHATDETSFYEYYDTQNNIVSNRIVSWETIIPTLYKYYKEDYTVVFLKSNGQPMTIYESQTNPFNWTGNEDRNYDGIPPVVTKYYETSRKDIQTICSFDVDEEDIRREPWTGKEIDTKINLDIFLKGGKIEYATSQVEEGKYIYDYGIGFIATHGEYAKFRETIGEYSIKDKEDKITTEIDTGIRNNKRKRVIVYQEI